MERFFDVLLAGAAILTLSPLILPLLLVLKCTGEGEIFFLQRRIGRGGRSFQLFKFATMLKDSPNLGSGTVTMKEDPRILPVGKVLRKTKINELPQLLNIVLGDMSLIGPRPLTAQTFQSYPEHTRNIVTRVRPGLSGLGSIIFRNEEEIMEGKAASLDFYDSVIAPYKGKLEEWFVSNKSLKLYFLAILVTVYVVIRPRSDIAWRVFAGLPRPPDTLRNALGG